MKNTKEILLILIIAILVPESKIAQKFGTGALLDQKEFESSPKAPPLSRGDFKKLPEIFSLKKFAPTPGDQGNSSTCTGWSTSYAARTIMEAIINDWSQEIIDKNKFSPSYVYNQIRPRDGCDNGTSIIDGMELLIREGVLPFNEFGFDCDREVKNEDKIKASNYRLKEYREIASRQSKNMILNIKKSLTQYKPVVIGINCPQSFYSAKDVWHPKKDEYDQRVNGHALTIIGFDDNVEGGAFEIINSWGVNWGNNGFIWIRYSDMEQFCVWAGELISDKKAEIKKQISAEIFIREFQNNIIELRKGIGTYQTLDTFSTGSMFQLYCLNKEPAYIYIFGFDTQKGAKIIYPMNELMSDYFAYNENHLIMPSEDYAFQLDKDIGTSSLIILISTEKIRNELNDLVKNTIDTIDVNQIITKLTSYNRNIFFDSEINTDNRILIEKSLNNHFISMTKIDIFHTD